MKKQLLIFLLIFAAIFSCQAQEQIEMEKVWGGYKYIQNGKLMKMRDLVRVMEPNEEASMLIQKAQSSNTFATILGAAGGGLIGWSLGGAIGGGEINWSLIGVGAGIIAIGIPISSNVNKNAKQAVELYNASLSSTFYSKPIPELRFVTNGSQIGLTLTF